MNETFLHAHVPLYNSFIRTILQKHMLKGIHP